MADPMPPRRKVTATAKIHIPASVSPSLNAVPRGTPALRARTRARVLLPSSPSTSSPLSPTPTTPTQTTPLHRSPLVRAATSVPTSTSSSTTGTNQGTTRNPNGLAPKRIAVVRATTSFSVGSFSSAGGNAVGNVGTGGSSSGRITASTSVVGLGGGAPGAGKARSEVGSAYHASESDLGRSSTPTGTIGRVKRFPGSDNMNANLTRTPTSSANGQYAPPTTPITPTLSTHNQTQGQTYSPFATTMTANNGLSFPPPHPLPADEPGSGSPLVSPRSGRREAGRVSRGLVAATMSHSQSHRRENGSSMVDSPVILGDGGDEPQQKPKKFRLKMASDEVSHVSSSSSLSYPPIPIPIPTNPVTAIASQHNGNNAVTADSTIHGIDPGRRSSHASTSASSELRRSQRRLRGESETNGIVHDSHTDSLSNYSHSHSGSTSQSGSQSDSNSEEELAHSNEDSDEGEEEDLELPPLVVSAEVRRRIVEEEDAKRSRKIADLEISNQSLMTINRTLEADVARKNRLISGMKRQLRASGQQVAPLGDQDEDEDSEQGETDARGNEEASDAGHGRPRKSRNTRPRRSSRSTSQSNSEQEDDDISAFLLATRAHSTRLTRLNDHVESLITRGREAGMRVAAMQEGGRGKVWGVLELGERDAQGNEEEDRVKEEDAENGEGEQGIGVELVDARTHPDSLSGSDEVSSEDSVRDRGAVD